jgi:hypothetical protein
MTASVTALWWARSRALGPSRSEPGTPAPDGFIRLVEPDADAVWLLPVLPTTAGPWVLEELGLSGPSVEQPNDTGRMLAAVARCCWPDPNGPIWPGVPAGWTAVMSVYRTFGDRDPTALHRASIAAIRRLHGAGWVLWDDPAAQVRLGPRAAGWIAADLTVLRELHRTLPAPREAPAPAPTTQDER